MIVSLVLMVWSLQGHFNDGHELVETYGSFVLHIADERISIKEAETLLFEATGAHRNRYNFEYWANDFELPFYPFVGDSIQNPGSTVVDTYDVNPYTGDVLDWHCDHPTSPAYEQHRKRIRERFQLSSQHYAELDAMRPRNCGFFDDEDSHVSRR